METSHIFLDTETFIANNFYFGASVFGRLAVLAEQEEIFIHLTTITIKEIEKHIISDIEQGFNHLKTLQKKERTVRVIALTPNTPFQIISRQFDIETVKQEALNSFHAYLHQVNADIIPVEGVSIDEVFDKYFKAVAPFGSGEKKYEFPDAFALAGLQRWCDDTGNKIIVISNDTDMSKACELSESFIPLQSIPLLLNQIATEQAELYAFAIGLFNEHKGEIESQLREESPDLMFFIDEPEGDVYNAEVLALDIIEELAIEVKDDHATFQVNVEVEIKANVFFAEYVVEDVPILMREDEIEKTLYMKAEVNLLYDRENANAFQLEYAHFDDRSILLDLEPSAYELK